ncbi:MAG: IF-2-associated domain-containing protein, partial [Rhodospirillales bacterium]|nr:IF-2-associated domain-containing protein [Rhodospirillales bacterium]
MTETNETDDGENKLEIARPKKLELKKTVETGQIRQNFSHGRSKMVQVEVKKKRTFARGAAGGMSEVKAGSMGEAIANLEAAELDDATLSRLTPSEREKRMAVLEEAKRTAEQRAIEEAAAAEAAEADRIEAEAQAERDAIKAVEEAAAAPEPEPEPEVDPAQVAAEAMPIPPSEKPNIKSAPDEDRAKKAA